MQTLKEKIEQVAHLIKEANSVVALTGAGISTPSGIPDFRSTDSSIWNKVNPMEVASVIAFRKRPTDFYEWVRPLTKTVVEAKPNAAHYALAHLEEMGKLSAVITQNIDGLHQAANSRTVFEVHGHIREVTCIECYQIKDATPIMEALLAEKAVPSCDKCGGFLKPNVILFGEQLPVETLFKAKTAAQEADLMIVVGSSLEVAPISGFPQEASEQGTKIIIINYDETYMDSRSEVVIRENVVEVLPKIAELVAQ